MGRRKETHYHKCYNCLRAHLVQYYHDPIIAECEVTHDKQVASTLLDCDYFKERRGEPVIEQRKKRLGITDYYI